MSHMNPEYDSNSKDSTTNTNEYRDSTTTLNPTKQDMKLVEAKTAVVLLKTNKLCTKNEYTQWLLKMLYQPRLRQDSECMNVVYLSRSRRRIWTTDFSINQEQNKGHLIHRNNEQLYVITPKTTIMTVAQENCIVYIVDLSSSLATIGNTQSDILLSEAYTTLRNSLEGLVQPFSMQVSPTEKAVFQPSIRITIMADYSQFASNMNIIPVLVGHPTMRVFMQNVVITASNIQNIIKKLKSEFLSFQHDTAQFRKVIKKTRNMMGYNLDVGSKTDPAVTDVLDATSFTSKHRQSVSINGNQSKLDESTKEAVPPDVSETQSATADQNKDTAYHSSKKEVWGVGKSGANLSRILHAGHFAMKLLPLEGTSRLILITDGTMKSNVHDNTFVRQFAEEDITCHIIQVGGSHDFIPGKNFGFVPDSEILKFLARATNGTFMYSDKCLPVANTNLTADKERSQSSINETVRFVDLNHCKHILNPNIYHHRILFRETTFTKNHNETRLTSDSDTRGHMRRESSNERQEKFSNFPWDPYATVPEEEWRLLKYREYVLPPEFSHIIAARARDGFIVQSVTFDDGTGSRQVDPDIHDLEAKDLSTMRKERVQIVMILHWQPNVVIEYRIRATWLPVVVGNSSSYNNETLLMSSGIFSRAKAPRAEIYVRTDVSFAHMLQNWDVFKRRAQMMGVVTGYIYFGETYAAPVYSKIEKLKKYLMDIYEGDEILKSTITFPSKFWMNVSNVTESAPNSLPSTLWSAEQTPNEFSGRYHLAHQQELFVESFRIFWDRLNAAETRARTRSWYDPGCIDLLVGNVSPFMTPKLSSVYNQDFVNNVEKNIHVMINNVKSVVGDWADFVGEDGTFVKMVHRLSTNFSSIRDDLLKETSMQTGKQPPSFCELRVRHEYGRLITLRLLFFNVEVLTRRKIAENLVHILKISPLTAVPCNTICQRSFSTLLMRDPKHFSDSSASLQDTNNQGGNSKIPGNLSKHQSRSKTWYLPFATWLTSEHIVHDYLHHTTWSWQTDSHDDTYHKHNQMMPIHDLAFQFLCQARLDQGYELVSPRQDSTQFYQEIKLPTVNGKRNSLCTIQYFVWKDSNTGKITTELWTEPTGEFDVGQYERVKKWAFEPDRNKISQLVTFDQIHAIGRSKVIGEFKDKANNFQAVEDHGDNHNVMLLPQLFDVSSVLRSNKFIVASFKCPRFEVVPHFHQTKLQLILPQHDDNERAYGEGTSSNVSTAPSTPSIRTKSFIRTQRYLRKNVHHNSNDFAMPLPPEEQNLFIPRPDSLLSGTIKIIAELNITLQSYAIHHYFVERSLEHISSGEINMSHHNLGIGFWNELKNALCKLLEDKKLTSTSLITDLRKTRCFVKVFDPRSFVVTLYPNLDSVTNSLLKLQKENASDDFISVSEDSKHIDVFMFECIRQKPMRPAKEGAVPETSNHFSVENIVDDTDKISIRPIDFLIHESDGLGEMLRPTLYEGHFSSSQTNAQLSERTLRVAQDVVKNYSKSFFNSFYACLVRGFIVSDDDLSKVMEVCHESSMEIDVTEFVNMMSTQSEEPIGFSREAQATEAQGKFNAIFNQYFEPVHTKTGKQMNLFYYKPSFSRYNATNIQAEDAPEDSRMSFIINLAVHSRSPLLVKLLCFSKTIPDNNNPETEDDSDTAVPINTLPTSYLDSLSTFGKKNLEKGKDQNNFPLMYKDNRILLQLVFLNMPKTELENSDPAGHSDMPPEAVENLTRSMQSQPECYNSLSTEQQLALVEIESRVKWLLVEETLHGLLKAPNISTPILNYVEKKLSKSNPYTGQNISIVIPFHFVKNNADSRKIFMKELEKDSYNNNTKYRLRRLGDYFYVSEDSVFNMGDEASYSNSNSPVTTENPPPSSEPESQCEDYCEGLGITLNTSCNKTDDENILANDADVSLCKRPLYWLIIVPRKSHIQIYYYSKIQTLESNSEILNAVKEKIKNIEERTNRMSLLNYLQETRICSAYLEVPGSSEEAKAYSDVESDESLSSDEPSDIFASADIKTGREYRSSFLPGQFSCPLVFTKRFPLHWRLQPNISLKFLTSDVLRLFKVINRSNTFVIERDESIVYCKIFEEVAGEHNQDSPNTVCSSPGQSDRLKSVEEDAKTIASFSIESSTKRDLAVAAATSPSRKRTASSSRTIGNESRDLVVQVYGINLPSWVESEFIDMIENRLITQITLTEVQQFLARNSTSKPTLADVEFILPIWKTPTRKEIVRVPRAIDNPGLFLHYFGQTIAADNIKSLNSPYIGDVLKRYHTDTFYNENNDIVGGVPKIQPDSHHNSLEETLLSTACFYYNCTKRVPGSSTPLELLVGQGMVGVCVTLLDEAGLPMTKVKREGSRNYSFDPETARHCLEQDFREVAAEDAYYHISLNFWSIGSLDSDALMQHLYECYRQSLCDYFIEKTVSMDFSMVLSDKKALQKAIATKSKGRLGTILRNKFVDSVLYTLKTASQMNSPTVYCMNKPIKTTPWCMDDLLRHLDATLRKIDINLRPVVASTPYNKEQWDSDIDACTTNNEWVLYKDYEHLHQQKIQENIRLVAISGLQEFVEKFGNISHASAQERRLSTTSLLGSQKSTSRRNSGDSAMTDHSGNQRNAKSRQDRSRASSTISNPGSIQKNGPQLDSKKHCFLILTLNESDLSIYTYNWSESLSFDLFKNISSFASRQEARIGILTNILHQKMGLFHHTEPIKDCVERFVSPSEQNVRFVPVNGTSSSIFSPSVPQSHVGSPIAKKPSQVDTSGMLSATASRGSTRRSTESSILPLANMLDFKDTITYTANVPRRNQLEAHKSNETAAKSKEQDTYFDKILQRSLIKSNELDQALMDSITNSVAETPFGREFDTLRRHGQSFLEAFLRRSKVQSAHRKALKVYIKWRKRYGDPQAGLDAAEKLSRQDVSTIMRSSRVLHFCRTPLIFCDPEKDWMSITQGQTTQHIASWYKDMADVLISEYAAYLEKADMQPIEFAKSEDEESQCVMVLSEFDFGKHLKAGCSPAYLLSVFEGGSIVCEIRITGIFLSVTLYTLHRQYGRLDYKRFRPETRSKKRENFRKFEKNSGQFKQMIHINSFVYDFHIRYLQKALDDPEHLPNNFDIMIFVRKLALSNILPSPFSKARITRGLYQIQTVNINPTTFFENLFKISTRCGFRNVLLKNSFSTTSISSTTPFFDKNYNENSNSNWKYTLVLSPSSENEIKSSDLDFTSRKNAKINPTYSITIEYFVLVSNQERMTPQNMTKKSWSTSQRLFNDFTSLSEITLIDEGYSLIDILHGAKAKIDYIVSEVTTTSKQIENWNKLYSADLSVPKADHSEFIDLINKFEHTDITKLDNDIASVFKMKLDWDAVLKTVIAVTRNNTKNFYANRNRHLLMYNARFMDFMVHLKVSQDNTIQGWLVTREKRANGIYVEGAERDQVINLSKMLYYHLWRVISNKSIV